MMPLHLVAGVWIVVAVVGIVLTLASLAGRLLRRVSARYDVEASVSAERRRLESLAPTSPRSVP